VEVIVAARAVQLVAATLMLFLAVLDAAAAQAPAKDQTAAKKSPYARLAEPWPDAEQTRRRRIDAESRRLFSSAEPLSFTLTADFDAVNKDRDPNSSKRSSAMLSVAGAGGKTNAIPVTLSARGHFRRASRNCEFVPLRVEFPKDDLKGTAFDGQKSLKLVTHCRDNDAFEQNVLREYAVYRLFNLLTPRSFRARLVKATYVSETAGKTGPTGRKTLTSRYGLLIEDDGDVARRMEGRITDLPRVEFKDLDRDAVTLMTIFEYMIGNTDLSIYSLHNVHLIQTQKQRQLLFPVPYDFDMAGVVNTSYATPDRRLGIGSVTDRLYRGPCRSVEELEPVVELFRKRQDALLAVFASVPDLSPSGARDANKYLAEFFSSMARPGSVKRVFVDGCEKKPAM
jgi:hypothetical protein